ncbi:hypothetical protein ACFX2G_044670 [Malus domestica]
MELQLGLALALPDHHSPVKGFDMNGVNRSVEKKEIVGLESKTQVGNYKRSFDVAFEKSSSTGAGNESKMLALLLWNDQPNEEDDDDKGRKRRNSCRSIIKNDDGGNHVVGWPPIKSWRKKMHHDHYQHHQYYPLQNNQMANNYKENENDGSAAAANNSMYVKVKMEGEGIVRKIDINLHHSFQSLRDTLITMFSKCKSKEGGAAADYILIYQDKQGDWLLAADVPWQTFIESVQRLQIVRNGG